VDAFYQCKSPFGRDGFHSVDACGLFPLVVLHHPSHGEQSCRFRFHQELLQFLCFPCFATLTGSIDAFLDAEDVLLSFLPGHVFPSHTRPVSFLMGWCIPIFHPTHALSSIQQGLRQHILSITDRRWLLRPSFPDVALVGTDLLDRPLTRAAKGFHRSDLLCSVVLDGYSPPCVLIWWDEDRQRGSSHLLESEKRAQDRCAITIWSSLLSGRLVLLDDGSVIPSIRLPDRRYFRHINTLQASTARTRGFLCLTSCFMD
jgi:hypothetical protein